VVKSYAFGKSITVSLEHLLPGTELLGFQDCIQL